jgi:hypothetical protein
MKVKHCFPPSGIDVLYDGKYYTWQPLNEKILQMEQNYSTKDDKEKRKRQSLLDFQAGDFVVIRSLYRLQGKRAWVTKTTEKRIGLWVDNKERFYSPTSLQLLHRPDINKDQDENEEVQHTTAAVIDDHHNTTKWVSRKKLVLTSEQTSRLLSLIGVSEEFVTKKDRLVLELIEGSNEE